MADLRNITFETNGTQPLQKEFKDYLGHWRTENKEITFSVSAKLSASGESWEDAIKPDVVANYQEVGTVYLKFVVETDTHIEEAVKATQEFRAAGFNGVVYLMPQGGVVEPYNKNRQRIADICCEQGWNYSPRLHVDLWGNGWGK
jgi:organic radical activating enzyme